MSHSLWKSFWENDVERFRRLLAPGHSSKSGPKSGHGFPLGALGNGSPGGLGTSPRAGGKGRKASGTQGTPIKGKDAQNGLGKSEVNSRDHVGLTLLLRAASSTNPNAHDLVQALLDHPNIDIYAQDPESGWNALHRALYAGNVSIARLLLEKERVDFSENHIGSGKVGHLIKTKDHEGNSPFDLYNSTIATRSLAGEKVQREEDSDSDREDNDTEALAKIEASQDARLHPKGEELFMFGSNKNLSLGVGDEDDRQFPERVHFHRPSHLIQRFYQQYLANHGLESPAALPDLEDIPNLIRSRPMVIRDVVMSKLHSAILTNDPVANLYVSGVGRGGRLGLGDENTQFRFVPVQGAFDDKNVKAVALGQNHSLAVTSDGELWTWGLNKHSQLGYVLPAPGRPDEEPMSLSPRQVFGSLRKETIIGVAASAIHSVAHTETGLYCWGRNVGQLALMDADSRSLDVQQTPRRVAPSLLTVPVEMVSAVDRATSVLLANSSVWVFTSYGYTVIKFPMPDVFTNHNLTATSFSNRYDARRKEIRYITSGEDTIAAITSRGDLFTMHLTKQTDPNQQASSTTNPVKAKNSVTTPQCIWDARKDGVVSVGVGEHGSVIICTDSGAVWKRVKRAKGKTAGFVSSSDTKRKDFKFQRVPYITNCVAVRSSIFGAFAALRNDSRVMSTDIHITQKRLWEDMSSMLSIRNFKAAERKKKPDAYKRWRAAISREREGTLPYELLLARDVVKELHEHLDSRLFADGTDLRICTSTAPDLQIPVHGWLLCARSPTLRSALSIYRRRGLIPDNETFEFEGNDGQTLITFKGVDIFTLLNLVTYVYLDTDVPVWKYTREDPGQAPRFRQIRMEVMKFATKLQMGKLEASARLQAGVERSLPEDVADALLDERYFEDGDVIIELDGVDRIVHKELICQRCPFFKGMFYGRSQGQWLAERYDVSTKVRVDLRHIHPDTFDYVLQYLYSDSGAEMFNDVAAGNIDDFSELIVDVLSVANELMLDRLSEICQSVIGKFATTRNISHLLNEISPCTTSNFKDAGLEYLCLQLENMLENHLLDDLDEDLLLDLDEVVRHNQQCRMPFVRSGRAELLLYENNPDLAADIEEEHQIRVKEMAYKLIQRDDDKKLSSSFKTRFGSLDEASGSPLADRSRRKSKAARNEPLSPTLRPRKSQGDFMFDMEDDEPSADHSPTSPALLAPDTPFELEEDSLNLPHTRARPSGNALNETSRSFRASPHSRFTPTESFAQGQTPDAKFRGDSSGSPWAPASLQTSKLDLRGIMTEASTSTLTQGLAAQKLRDEVNKKAQTPAKISQKERKKQMQAQAAALIAAEEESAAHKPWEKVGSKPPPWKQAAASSAPKPSLKDAMTAESSKAPLGGAVKPLVAAETTPKSVSRRTASPDTRFAGQSRTTSSPAVPTAASSSSSQTRPKPPLVPHSKSYMTPAPKFEETIGMSLSDVMSQQAREQELVKEAVAKRSLQEIQQEQEFQQWWDQESRRAQEEEARRLARAQGKEKATKGDRGGKRGGGGGGGGGRRGKGKGKEGDAKEKHSQGPAPAPGQAQGKSKGQLKEGVVSGGDGGVSSHRGRPRGRGRGQ